MTRLCIKLNANYFHLLEYSVPPKNANIYLIVGLEVIILCLIISCGKWYPKLFIFIWNMGYTAKYLGLLIFLASVLNLFSCLVWEDSFFSSPKDAWMCLQSLLLYRKALSSLQPHETSPFLVPFKLLPCNSESFHSKWWGLVLH